MSETKTPPSEMHPFFGIDGEEYCHEDIALGQMLLAGILHVHGPEWADGPQTLISVVCSDLFSWGCADSEDLPTDEIGNLYKHWKRGEIDLWVCKRRKMRPQKPIVDGLKKAGKWTDEWEALPPNPFDAHCGTKDTCGIHGEQEKVR